MNQRLSVQYAFDGLLGVVVITYATYVIMFIIFGSFMEKSGVGKFLIDLPYSLAGRLVGGPAKVSVVASALFGSVSGSAVANTVATGTFYHSAHETRRLQTPYCRSDRTSRLNWRTVSSAGNGRRSLYHG